MSFLSSLPVGVTSKSISDSLPELLNGNYLHTVDKDLDINEKYTIVSGKDLLYLPETEYIRFFENILKDYGKPYTDCFLSAIGYGDAVYNALYGNHLESEKKIKNMKGIRIIIRGFVTDCATYNYIFGKNRNLGEGTYIDKWDYYIVVNSNPEVADKRIENSGIPRTWREDIKHLRYISDYYMNFESELFGKKIIIENKSLEKLEYDARKLADIIYAESDRNIE